MPADETAFGGIWIKSVWMSQTMSGNKYYAAVAVPEQFSSEFSVH